jgi:3-oxoacyl-[acyl-carrier-protein] synthase II
MKKRVVITGIGAVSPLGHNVPETWQNLLAGKSGIAAIKNFDASYFPVRIAAEVKNFSLSPSLKTKNNKFAMHFTNFALEAALEAFNDAELLPDKYDNSRFGVVVGSGMMTAEYDYLKRFQQTAAPDGEISWQNLSGDSQDFFALSDFGKTTSNTGLALLASQFDLRGFASSVHTACASGGQALGLAMQVIRRGNADCMLAGGFDSMINPLGLSSFCLLGALSTYNETPTTASRPFDAERNGFVLGEGAAFLILESLDHAKSRGAKIYAEIAGEGNTLSSYRITDSPPNGDGASQAIAMALRDAGLKPMDVDYINAHGTSTKMNDLSETNAIKAVFQEQAYKLPISSTKSQTGHLIAAAGALEAVFSVLAIKHHKIPMTANLTTQDPECDLDYVAGATRVQEVNVVLSNSFGFGGSNSTLIFKNPEFGSQS